MTINTLEKRRSLLQCIVTSLFYADFDDESVYRKVYTDAVAKSLLPMCIYTTRRTCMYVVEGNVVSCLGKGPPAGKAGFRAAVPTHVDSYHCERYSFASRASWRCCAYGRSISIRA